MRNYRRDERQIVASLSPFRSSLLQTEEKKRGVLLVQGLPDPSLGRGDRQPFLPCDQLACPPNARKPQWACSKLGQMRNRQEQGWRVSSGLSVA
jgi:hypothetical protein